jgi:NAD(P)-dependent dehydrogenase (short-subunit alcohol dehydrogenase family)
MSCKANLISRGARGIGRGLARHFLEQGHRVFVFDINDSELNYVRSSHLKAQSDQIATSLCNLRDVEDIRKSVKKTADFFGGKIDVLINNGGIANPYWKDGKTMEDRETITEWQAYLEANLTAPFALSQACIPYMKTDSKRDAQQNAAQHNEAGPCIIQIGSFRALQSDPDQEGYASTKAGLLGLTQSMAISCERWGIRVNLIAPGRIKMAQ